MIEINLLPEEMRKADHTPPARLGAIVAGVVFACALACVIGYYKMVKIPKMDGDIFVDKTDIKILQAQKDEVDAIDLKKADLTKKITTLTNLIATRLLYTRLMDTLCDATNQVDGAWFRSFTVTPDGLSQGGGKRFQLSLTGYTTGGSDLERDQKLKDMISSLTYWFRERQDVVDKETSFNKFIGATFERPVLITESTVPAMPQPVNITDAGQLKAINAPKEGLDFNLTISFALQAPKQQQ